VDQELQKKEARCNGGNRLSNDDVFELFLSQITFGQENATMQMSNTYKRKDFTHLPQEGNEAADQGRIHETLDPVHPQGHKGSLRIWHPGSKGKVDWDRRPYSN
jgi:hypothetical protein